MVEKEVFSEWERWNEKYIFFQTYLNNLINFIVIYIDDKWWKIERDKKMISKNRLINLFSGFSWLDTIISTGCIMVSSR